MSNPAERWTTRAAAALRDGHVFMTSAVPGVVLTVVTRHDDDRAADSTWYANLTVTPRAFDVSVRPPGVSTGPGMLAIPAATFVHVLDDALVAA